MWTMDELPDIGVELEGVSIFYGSLKEIHAWMLYTILMVVFVFYPLILFVDTLLPECLVASLVSAILLTWMFLAGSRQRVQFIMNGRGAKLKGRPDRDVMIVFGPHVVADVVMDSKDRNADGWGGFRGMALWDGNREILVSYPFIFRESDVKAAWPAFVRVVRAHDMRVGPTLAKILEMGQTGQGRLVTDRRPKFQIAGV